MRSCILLQHLGTPPRATGLALMAAVVLALAGHPVHADAGKPSFEGIWLPVETAPPQPAANAPGPPGADAGAPLQLSGSPLQCAPVQHLSVGGGGMSMLLIQNPQQIVLVSEFDMDIGRKIYLQTRHPTPLQPQPNGHSIGHWDGNTLVVDSVGFADKDGHDRGQHLIERFSRDGEVLTDEVTIEQSGAPPKHQTLRYQQRADVQFNENVCEEGFDRYQILNGKLDNPNIPPDRAPQH